MSSDTPRFCLGCGGELEARQRNVRVIIGGLEESIGRSEVPTCSSCGSSRMDLSDVPGRLLARRVLEVKSDLGLPEDAEVKFLFEEVS